MEKGQWQIYTGDGKGKTTAAVGLAARASGYGKRICMIQFLKRGDTGEYRSLERLGVAIDVGERIEAPPWDPKYQDEWRAHTRGQFEKAKQAVLKNYDLVILDELMTSVQKGFISEADVIALAVSRSDTTELLMTGRGATPLLIESADLVTEMRPIKHYADKGLAAREGIEY